MEPLVIKKLDKVVINRIAAGEVVQRPANALKELIENSLDAKSTQIQISVKAGGLKFLEVRDNGVGINKNDLAVVCERFTTSKLEKIEDLSCISTYGFRGEALASISHIAHLTIQTKTFNEKCAFRTSYKDGKMKSPPVSCAGNQGTTITVENMFYNLPQRIKSIKSSLDEYQKIFQVVSKYAVHNPNVGFILKKDNELVFRTPIKTTVVENIKLLYGEQIAKQLIEMNLHNKMFNFKVNGLITNVNYSGNKSIFLFFVNHRLVDSTALKTALDEIYRVYLPKGQYPFIYISLELDPSVVDVNIHPTKYEVKFLNEDEIIGYIKEHVEIQISENENTRIFRKEIKPIVYDETTVAAAATTTIKSSPMNKSNSEKVYAKNNVRTSSKEQKLEKFLISSGKVSKTILPQRKEIKLTSILNMRNNIEDACSNQLKQILKQMTFVGVVNKIYSLFQFETKLFLCDTISFSRELFYQLLVFNFQNFQKIHFKEPLDLSELCLIALECKESGWTEEDGEKELLANRAAEILTEKKEIMKTYFGIIIEEGKIETIPVILENYKPSMCFLPIFILRLATEVEWDDEEKCFETFCREMADFCSRVNTTESTTKNHKWIVEHVIYPAFRNKLIPNNQLKKHLFELTNLTALYKVFERC